MEAFSLLLELDHLQSMCLPYMIHMCNIRGYTYVNQCASVAQLTADYQMRLKYLTLCISLVALFKRQLITSSMMYMNFVETAC